MWFFFPLRRIKISSIKFKVSVLYTVVLGIILVTFCTALYFVLSIYLYQDIDARGFDPLAWHVAFARTLSRVREWNRQGCRSDAHREDQAALRPVG